MKKTLLIINTGTPDDPGVRSVRKYLSEFLNDPHVIDLPWLARKILVNLIIIPFRVSRSATLYRKLWTREGSPLKINLENLVTKLQDQLKEKYTVLGAMRYGNPSLKASLEKVRTAAVNELTILPLFPQYASSTTGSIRELLMKEIKSWNPKPKINFIDQFYSHPAFINAFSVRIRHYQLEKFDHILFSYHSLPVKHLQKIHPRQHPVNCSCSESLPENGHHCYKATCHETTRLLAEKLNLINGTYSTSFQSRLSGKWIAPFTDNVLEELAKNNRKHVLVIAPSFVSDCLETIIEIGDEYRNLFIRSGGEELVLVQSLNDDYNWINAIVEIIDD